MKIPLTLQMFLSFIVISGCFQTQNQARPDAYFPLPDEPGDLITSEVQDFYLQHLVNGLSIPWGMTFLPEGIMLITQRTGEIRKVAGGELLEGFIEGGPEVFVGGTSGLMDIVAHPGYKDNGWIYITYSAPEGLKSHTALMRARLNPEMNALVDQEVLFTGEPKVESGSHSGSRIAFRNNEVFFSIGDRGIPLMDSAQDTGTHHGTIIRLHDDGSIPYDNPFTGNEAALPHIWSYGHRNPQGLAFNPETGSLWANEHGPVGGDEVNIIEKGVNYGWPEISYGKPDPGTTLSGDTEKEGMRSAHYYWVNSVAPSGLTFVTSDKYPGWLGDAMVSTLIGGKLIRLILEGDEIVGEEHLLEGIGRIRNVKMGPDGFLYIAIDSTGEILRLIPAEMIN